MRNREIIKAWLVLNLTLFAFGFASYAEQANPIFDTVVIPRISPIPSDVSGAKTFRQSLDGMWKFIANPAAGFETAVSVDGWADIKVPGEWAMQGFDVERGKAAGYFRTFAVPSYWKNKRVKLRFNAVYSDATVYVNGKKAGSHVGGFTAFELDVTELIKIDKENTLSLAVKNESVADSLASGSKYACHPLGGISRSVSLIALPQVNISSLAMQTIFDKEFKDATLTALIDISNESSADVSGMKVDFELSPWKSTKKVTLGNDTIVCEIVKPGQTAKLKFSAEVAGPKKWDCENPNLYVLTCKLIKGGKVIETVKQRFGFRQCEVIGNQLFVNGTAVKLRGVNRHEVYPLTGRSVPKEMYRRDIELFREGNVNHIRTCHYQPDEALMEAADELGMFIECEGSFCWAHKTRANQNLIREATVGQTLEMVVLNRNHPSIIFWSLANESHWNGHFEASGKAVAAIDPTRPRTFNYYPWGWGSDGYHKEDERICRIGSDHYPGFRGASKFANYHRPVSFGEFCHLNAYNRFELATDVSLRDKWGKYFHKMWEDMYKSKGCLGGSIWAGIDDTFYWDFQKADGSIEERTVGYGTWGPIDGWRRRKPEWWSMKKTYSPVRVAISTEQRAGAEIVVDVENRQDFSNINRLKISWQIAHESGTAAADIKPGSNGKLVIKPKTKITASSKLKLVFDDPRGFNIDSFSLPLGKEEVEPIVINESEHYKVKKSCDNILVSSGSVTYTIDSKTGLIRCSEFTGPHLMILPLNGGGGTQMHGPTKYYEPFSDTCSDWKAESVSAKTENGFPVIRVAGSYKEATGEYAYIFNADGTFTIDYDFQTTGKVNPRQLGIVFDFPKSYENLAWKRKGYWSIYPDWHIARLEGTAKASEGFDATPVGPRNKPGHQWRHDRTKIGSNDFASTKHNVYNASLTNSRGKGLHVYAGADKHIRTWKSGDMIRMLIAHYSNGGDEGFLRRLVREDNRPLSKGDTIKDSVKMRVK